MWGNIARIDWLWMAAKHFLSFSLSRYWSPEPRWARKSLIKKKKKKKQCQTQGRPNNCGNIEN